MQKFSTFLNKPLSFPGTTIYFENWLTLPTQRSRSLCLINIGGKYWHFVLKYAKLTSLILLSVIKVAICRTKLGRGLRWHLQSELCSQVYIFNHFKCILFLLEMTWHGLPCLIVFLLKLVFSINPRPILQASHKVYNVLSQNFCEQLSLNKAMSWPCLLQTRFSSSEEEELYNMHLLEK